MGGRAVIRLSLLDAAGRPLDGGARAVVVTPVVPDWLLTLPLAVPLLAGLAVTLWRRRQITAARSLSPEQRQQMA
jgi:hypothetical protein